MSDLSDQAQPRCKVILEDWHPEVEAAIWADPSPDALRIGIDALAELLTSLVDRPDMTSPSSFLLTYRRQCCGEIPPFMTRWSGVQGMSAAERCCARTAVSKSSSTPIP